MLEKLEAKFYGEVHSPEARSLALKKYRLLWLLHLILAILTGLSLPVLIHFNLTGATFIVALLMLGNFILSSRCDNLCKLLVAVSYLDQNSVSPAMTEPSLADEPSPQPFVPASTELAPVDEPPPTKTADILTPRIEGIQEWFEFKEWKVANGAIVNVGDIVAELENDEIIVEVEVMDSGQISLRASEGYRVDSGDLLATLLLGSEEDAD